MSKKTKSKKPAVKVNDLRSKKNPKGGATQKFSDLTIQKTYDKTSPLLSSATSSTLKIK